MSNIPNDLAVAILRELRNLREDVESKFSLDFTDIGFTADEESRENRKKPRFSKDVQLTALIDPTTDPMSIVAPASTSSVTKDPFANLGGMEWNFTQTAKTSPKLITLSQKIATDTNEYVTLESPLGTDYQVPAGKELYWSELLLTFMATVPTAVQWGYGDTAVPEQAAAPTNAVGFNFFEAGLPALPSNTTIRMGHHQNSASPWQSGMGTSALLGVVPASKYPFLRKVATTSSKLGAFGWGLEVST